MAGGRRAGRGFLLRPVRPSFVRSRGGQPHPSTTTKVPLQWSFTLAATIPTSTVTTDDEDAWSIPLEWSFLLDVDPPDDVED